jgi:hypothetical protein
MTKYPAGPYPYISCNGISLVGVKGYFPFKIFFLWFGFQVGREIKLQGYFQGRLIFKEPETAIGGILNCWLGIRITVMAKNRQRKKSDKASAKGKHVSHNGTEHINIRSEG